MTERKEDVFLKTLKLFQSYRDMVKFLGISTEESQQEARARTKQKLDVINAALQEMEARRTQQHRAYEYKAFKMYFVDGCTYEKIAEEFSTSKNTPRRWVSSILKDISTLLWGYLE